MPESAGSKQRVWNLPMLQRYEARNKLEADCRTCEKHVRRSSGRRMTTPRLALGPDLLGVLVNTLLSFSALFSLARSQSAGNVMKCV